MSLPESSGGFLVRARMLLPASGQAFVTYSSSLLHYP
uniref:Uncharacterized protein n=1 Tax=mine drainage metagenome TaxID=410659 RepID=E6QN47_9ZZZZ